MEKQEIERIVFDRKPALKSLIEKHGHLPVSEYFKKELPKIEVTENRKKELIAAIKNKVQSLLGQKIAENVSQELEKNYFCSTADHHGPLCHPFFLNSNLVQSLVNQKQDLKNVLILACSNISINNSSYPRGIFFHDKDLKETRIPFFSLKHRHHPVFGLPAYQKEKLGKIPESLKSIYLDDEVLDLKNYSDQITKTNFGLWKKIPGQSETNLIYLNQEEIVADLILKHHLNKETAINRIFFNSELRNAFEKFFDGTTGAFSSKNKRGTFLFWTIKDNHRSSLRLEKNQLVSEDSGYRLDLNPEKVHQVLTSKEILPSMALSFIVLSFYYGLPCGGGFSQINYLEEIKRAYLKVVGEFDREEESKAESVPTNVFRGEFALAMLRGKSKILPAASIDLILYKSNDTSGKIQELAQKITLKTAIYKMMPEFYKIITGQKIEAKVENLIQPIVYVP